MDKRGAASDDVHELGNLALLIGNICDKFKKFKKQPLTEGKRGAIIKPIKHIGFMKIEKGSAYEKNKNG